MGRTSEGRETGWVGSGGRGVEPTHGPSQGRARGWSTPRRHMGPGRGSGSGETRTAEGAVDGRSTARRGRVDGRSTTGGRGRERPGSPPPPSAHPAPVSPSSVSIPNPNIHARAHSDPPPLSPRNLDSRFERRRKAGSRDPRYLLGGGWGDTRLGSEDRYICKETERRDFIFAAPVRSYLPSVGRGRDSDGESRGRAVVGRATR